MYVNKLTQWYRAEPSVTRFIIARTCNANGSKGQIDRRCTTTTVKTSSKLLIFLYFVLYDSRPATDPCLLHDRLSDRLETLKDRERSLMISHDLFT